MLKHMAIFVFVVIVAVSAVKLMATQKKTTAQENAGERNQLSTTINSNNCVPAQQEESSANSVQGWHKFVTWPEGITAWALIFTLFAIASQAWLMRVHAGHLEELARATHEQATIAKNALIAQFRPKIVIRSIQFNPSTVEEFDQQSNSAWKIEISIVNAGDTIAHVTYCAAISYWMDNLRRSRADIGTEEWEPYSLNPGETRRLILPVKQSTFRTNLNIVESAIKRGNEPQEFPVCKGSVFYADENRHIRETGFERRWDIQRRRFIASEDPEAEYSD
jgi:hypothetical protein